MPYLWVMYTLCFVDRTNLNFAALQMLDALGMSATAFGLCAGVFFVTLLIMSSVSR